MMSLVIVLAVLPPPQDTLPYRFTLENRQSIESAAATRGVHNNVLNVTGTFMVVIDDTVGGKSVAVQFDSVRLRSSNPEIGGNLPSVLTNTRYHFVISDGRPLAEPMPDSLTLGSIQVMPVVNALFPAIRMDASLGEIWSDTTATDSLVAGMRMTGHTMTDWRVVDRRVDTLTLAAAISGTATADLGGNGKITMSTRGTSRLAITPGWPAWSTSSTTNSSVDLTMGRLTTRMVQQLRLTITRRDLRPPPPRKEVPL